VELIWRFKNGQIVYESMVDEDQLLTEFPLQVSPSPILPRRTPRASEQLSKGGARSLEVMKGNHEGVMH
jgi:hypothetical protein